jgi:hypothetical protein
MFEVAKLLGSFGALDVAAGDELVEDPRPVEEIYSHGGEQFIESVLTRSEAKAHANTLERS